MANGDSGNTLVRLVIALVLAVVAGGIFMATSCQRGGAFGRRQLIRLKPEQEKALGAQAFQEVLGEAESKGALLEGGPVVRAVRQVTDRLVRATKNRNFLEITKLAERDYDWKVRVIRSKEVNAFCLPGGKMVVYTAILPVCQTDAGLATVMGHEISHALARHGAERMAQQQLAQIGITAAGASLGNVDPRDRERILQVLNAGARFGILKYSRSHETEADHVGLLLMATAGYPPKAAIKFWERMQKMAGGGRTPEFMSTHPSHETRIRDLIKWQDQAMPLYKASPDKSAPRELPSLP
jgi:predicted Zn-dependent protease